MELVSSPVTICVCICENFTHPSSTTHSSICLFLDIVDKHNLICVQYAGRKNIHLDMNPWWWLEAAEAIRFGAESLSYSDPQVWENW